MALLKKTPKLKAVYDLDGVFVLGYFSSVNLRCNGAYGFCADELRRFFDVPIAATAIWLAAYDEKGDDRVEIRSRECRTGTKTFSLMRGGEIRVEGKRVNRGFNANTYEKIRELLRKYNPIYVSCEYEVE